MMICPKCGTNIHEGSKFCSECGAVLKDFGKESVTEITSEPKVEYGEYEEEAFFRVGKNAAEEVLQPYEVVPKQSRKSQPIPPPVREQIAADPLPKVEAPLPQAVYTQVPQSPPSAQAQGPSAPPQFQQAVVRDGVVKKKKANKGMILLSCIVVALVVLVIFMVLSLYKGSQVVKINRHNGLSSTVEQGETVSLTTDFSIEESQGVDPEEEALRSEALKEEQLLKDKEDIRIIMNIYYASFIESINEENSDSLVFSTDANKEIVDYKIENPNKGYLFIANEIWYDLDSIQVIEDEETGEKTATLTAKFFFTYRKKTETDNDWVGSENLQKCFFIYDSKAESWLVDNTEIDSTIELGADLEIYNFA